MREPCQPEKVLAKRCLSLGYLNLGQECIGVRSDPPRADPFTWVEAWRGAAASGSPLCGASFDVASEPAERQRTSRKMLFDIRMGAIVACDAAHRLGNGSMSESTHDEQDEVCES